MRRSTPPLLRQLQAEEQEEEKDDDVHETEPLFRKKRIPGEGESEEEEQTEGEAELTEEPAFAGKFAPAILSAHRNGFKTVIAEGMKREITPRMVQHARQASRPAPTLRTTVEQWQRGLLAEGSARYRADIALQFARKARGEPYSRKFVDAFNRGYAWNYPDEDHRGIKR